MSKRRHQKKAPDKKAFQPKLTLEEWLQKGKTFDLFLTDVLCPGHLWPALDAPDPALDVLDAPDPVLDVLDAPDPALDVLHMFEGRKNIQSPTFLNATFVANGFRHFKAENTSKVRRFKGHICGK